MNKFTRCLFIFLFIVFEIYAGVRLLTDYEGFSNSAIITFGVFSLLAGAVMLFLALDLKKSALPYQIGMALAVLNIILGICCIAFSANIVAAFPVLAIAYGIIMVFVGIEKLGNYFVMKSWGYPRHWLWMVLAVLTIVLGVIIILNPFTAVDVTFTYAGYFLIFSGVVDLFVFIFSFFF